MNYRKKENSRLTNQLLEERYFQNKFLNESTNFTMLNKKIIKTVDGKPEDLTDEEEVEISRIKTTDEDKNILAAIEKLNLKFGQK
jgi:ribonuclease D